MKKLSLLVVLLVSFLMTNCETAPVNDETGIEPLEQLGGHEREEVEYESGD